MLSAVLIMVMTMVVVTAWELTLISSLAALSWLRESTHLIFLIPRKGVLL